MRNIYKLFALLFTFSLFWGCENTKLGDKDLDFDVTIDNKELVSYIGKPVKIGISVDILDSQNNYPFETKIKSATGLLKSGTETVNSEEALDYDYRKKGTLYFEYTPVQKGKETVTVTIRNELVTRTVSCEIECKDALYNVEVQDAPDKPLIDTKFDFSLIVNEMEATGADSIVAYAKVLKGEGTVYSGEDIINIPISDTEEKAMKAGTKTAQLAIGKNTISYLSTKEGENTIRFYITNKWGIETYQDVTTSINLPAWSLSNSMGQEYAEVPYQDNYSFNLSVDEADIFKDNEYTAFFRILSNTDLDLSINDKKYNQGASFGLNAGGNVGILKVNDATQEGIIEFIVKDKYKQEHKDTIRFASKLPVKPIVASLDKSSQSVKVLQEAVFKLSLSEQNYNGLFNVSLEQLSGTGTFDNGNSLLFSEGTHTIKYTPKTQGAHTFKITVKDGNNQEKVLNATVQATISPLNVALSATSLNIAQGGTGTLTLSTTEADYTDNFTISYTASGAANKFEFGQNVLGAGGKVNYKAGDNLITITGLALGTSAYNLIIEDIYNQKKELSFSAIVKGQVSVSASTGGTATGGGSFNLNQSCTVKATPNTGNQFAGWYNGSTKVSDDAIYTFPVTESISLEAKFSTKVYIISATAETGGSVTGAGTYNHGATATLKATVNTGYTFAGWYEGATKVSTAAEYQITVTEAKTFVARFTANSYNITVNAQTGGTVSGGGTKKYNETATVTATPGTGYTFAGWYNGNNKVSDAATYNFTVTGAVTLEARFTANKYAITVNALDGGTVSGGGNFDFGSNISVTATPSANYDFLGWYEDDKQASTSATYNFTVSKARILEARFKLKEYILTVSASAGGTASGSGTYEYNSTVTITATAATGYTFDGWYEGSNKLSGNASYVIKVTGARSIEAKFTANKYNVVVNALTGGTATGSGSFAYNTNVTVTATASTNYTFDGWYENTTKVSSSLSYTFKITKETTLEAKFTANKFTVTATATTGGTVTGSGSYDYNTNATVTATAGSTYQFTGWYENNSQVSTSNPYIFKVEKARILEARFEQIKYTVTATASTGGTVTGSGTYVVDTDVSVTATPSTGYSFDGWYNGNSKVSSSASYTFKATANVTLEAKFTVNQYTISATAETGGSVTGAGTYNHGATATLKATVNTGYTFAGWYEGATKVSTAAEYQITVTAAKTFVARFTANSYNITVNAQTGGTVSGGGTKKYNETATVTATPGTGYTFAGWYNGNNKVSDAATYNFTVTGAVTLEARFTANKYAITVNALDGGTVSGGGNFDFGSNISVTATPSANYDFLGWYEDDKQASTSATYNFTVSKARILEARFKLKEYILTVSASAGGTASGSGTYEYNSTVTITATAATGYTFDGWYKGSNKLSGNASYVIKVTGARSIEAKFTANKYNVVVNALTGGTATGSGSFAYNTNVTVTATASTNYTFDGWYENTTKVSSSLSYTFKITKETTLDAKFTPNKFTVTLSGTNGTQTGNGSYDYNTNATITATPATNYEFAGWYENNSQISASNPYVFKVEKDRIIEARYQLVKRTVTLTAGIGGTAIGGGSFNHGMEVTVTATPVTGYSFDGWYNGETKVSASTSYKFTITENVSLTAKFTINKYTISAIAETGGTVTGSGTYNHGATVTLKATANTGYSFDGWYEGTTKVSTAAEYQITVTAARTLVAKFTINKYTVSATAETGGTVTGGGQYNHGATATLKATVNTGYTFAGWYEGTTKVSTAAEYQITVTAAKTFVAKFTVNQYTISATAETGGSVTGAGTYNHGATATLKATVNTGYTFAGWYEGATKVSTAAEYQITVTAAKTFVARFTANSYNITVNAQTGGTVSGGGTKKYNETATVTATPGTGYTFAGWYNGNNKVSDAATYNFTVTGAVTLEARFTANKYNIVVNAQTGGTASGSGSFDYNTNTTVTATPNTGYEFAGWYNGSTKVSDVLSYTFTVTGAVTLEARFTIKSFNIIVNAQTGGSATGGGTYNYGTNVTLKATVNNGYTFAGWYLNNSKVSEALNYTFTVSQAATYEARFTINQYNLVVNAGTGGTVSGSGTYNYNSTVTAKATANSHYSFDGWYEGTTKVSSSATYTFTLLKATTLSAKFVIDKHTVTLSGTNGTQTGGGSFDYNTNATITATPGANYQFTGWYENNNQISTSNPYTFAVTANRIIEARYQLIKRTVTLTAGTGGTAAGGGSFNHGTSVTLTATPNTGYSFDGWYNGSTKVSSSTSYTFTVTADISLTAKFVINKYLLTLSAETGGTVSGGGTYDHGTSVTAVATANTGYTFDGWYNGATKVSSNAGYTFTLTSAMTLTAKFKLNTYTVSVSAETGGTATGGGTFNHGTSVTLTATPNTGYSFDGWYNGSTKVSSSTSYTFTLTSAVTLTAKFTLNSYTVSVSAETGGTATGSGTFNHGSSVTVTTTNSNTIDYKFLGWYEGATKVSSDADYTFTVTANRNLVAKYEKLEEIFIEFEVNFLSPVTLSTGFVCYNDVMLKYNVKKKNTEGSYIDYTLASNESISFKIDCEYYFESGGNANWAGNSDPFTPFNLSLNSSNSRGQIEIGIKLSESLFYASADVRNFRVTNISTGSSRFKFIQTVKLNKLGAYWKSTNLSN